MSVHGIMCPQCDSAFVNAEFDGQLCLRCEQCSLLWIEKAQFDALCPPIYADRPVDILPSKSLTVCPQCRDQAMVNAERPLAGETDFRFCETCRGVLIHDFDTPGLQVALSRARAKIEERGRKAARLVEPERPMDVPAPKDLGPASGKVVPEHLQTLELGPRAYGTNFWRNCIEALAFAIRPSTLIYVAIVAGLISLVTLGALFICRPVMMAFTLSPVSEVMAQAFSALLAQILFFFLLLTALQHGSEGRKLYISVADYDGFLNSFIWPILRIMLGLISYICLPILLAFFTVIYVVIPLLEWSGLDALAFEYFLKIVMTWFVPNLETITNFVSLAIYSLIWIPLLVSLSQTRGFWETLNLTHGWRLFWHGKWHGVVVILLNLSIEGSAEIIQNGCHAVFGVTWGGPIAYFSGLVLTFYGFHIVGLLIHQHWNAVFKHLVVQDDSGRKMTRRSRRL